MLSYIKQEPCCTNILFQFSHLQFVMEKAPLKLKLKLGSTPEPPVMEVESNTALSEEEDEVRMEIYLLVH